MSNIIQTTLNEYFKTDNKGMEHKNRLYPTHASAYIDYKKYKKLQGKCLRAAYYHCLGHKDESTTSTDSFMVMKLGDYTEKMILDILKEKGVLVDSGVKFEIDKYKICGKLDAIITEDTKQVGLEIKSIGSNKYTVGSIFGSGTFPGYPKWQNLFQTLVYCYAFRDKLPYFYITYIRRDTCEMKSFKVQIEPIKGKMYPVVDGKVDWRFTVDDILDRYALLQSFISKETIPPKEYMKEYKKEDISSYVKVGFISQKQADTYNIDPFGDFECRYCNYRARCDKDDKV